ncbi:MAG: hypothetical protein ACXAE3_12035 [Candidatus Kariarchaeaceae archaeon]
MQGLVIYFLENRTNLGRTLILATLIPFFLSTIPRLQLPMLITAVFLFITLNYWRLKKIIVQAIHSHYWLKIQYFWFITGLIVTSALFYENVKRFIPVSYFIGVLYFLIYIIWSNKINSKMTSKTRIILRGHTKETSRSWDLEPYLLALILAFMVTFTIAYLQSIVISFGQKVLVPEVVHWLLPITLMILHFGIDLLFVEQIDWYPAEGSVEWIDQDFDLALPEVEDASLLAQYMEKASKLKTPPEDLRAHIEENLHYLVLHAQEMRYLPFQVYYVRGVGNWGDTARDQIHLMMAIVVASISQYRFLGLIPVYKRKMFYEMLQSLAMTGSMTQDWRDVIQYEVLAKKDEHFVLDWVLGSKYVDLKYDPDWIISWKGRVYKGKTGYYTAVKMMEELLQTRPTMDQWVTDIWELCKTYTRVYIGESARQVGGTNLQYYEQLLYLAEKKTTSEYMEAREAYLESLKHPSNRLVSTGQTDQVIYSEEEKEKIIRSYLSDETELTKTPSILDTFKSEFFGWREDLRSIELRHLLNILLYLSIFAVNLGVIIAIDRLVFAGAGIAIIAVEVTLLFFFSINPSDGDLSVTNDIRDMRSVLSGTGGNQGITINSAALSSSLWFLLYGVLLLAGYRLFL